MVPRVIDSDYTMKFKVWHIYGCYKKSIDIWVFELEDYVAQLLLLLTTYLTHVISNQEE